MRKFYDIETGEQLTTMDLYKEFEQMQTESPDEYNYSFSEYLNNCLTSENGTLIQIIDTH